ncbi:Is4 [Ixodes scapularis]
MRHRPPNPLSPVELGSPQSQAPPLASALQAPEPSCQIIITTMRVAVVIAFLVGMLSLTAVLPEPASAGSVPADPADADVFQIALELTGGDEEAAILTLMNEYMQELTDHPVLLYQCYRNGTTIETEDARNLSILFDGVGKEKGQVSVQIWYVNGDSGEIIRPPNPLSPVELGSPQSQAPPLASALQAPEPSCQIIITTMRVAVVIAFLVGMLSLTAVLPEPASAGSVPADPADADVFQIALELTGGDEEAAILTLMNEYMQELTDHPVLLYQCYRNGTTIETEDARNLSILFDGVGKEKGQVSVQIWYVNGDSGEIIRDTAELTHHTDSDTVTFAATGATSEVTLVDFRGYKSHYITEDVDGNAKVGKIYDVDLTCTNGQELYEEVCPDGCGMVATRSFVF